MVRDTGRCSVLCCNCHYVPDRSPGIIRRNRKMDLKGKKVLVFGAGKSGIGAADLLGSVGAQPIIYDGNENLDKEAVLHKTNGKYTPEIWAGDFPEGALDSLDLVVLSPGVTTENTATTRVSDHPQSSK